DVGIAVRDGTRRAGGATCAPRNALPSRARRQAAWRRPARGAAADRMTGDTPSEWQYVAAAYLVVFVTVLLWVAIIAAKLQRLQREVGAMVESARKTHG